MSEAAPPEPTRPDPAEPARGEPVEPASGPAARAKRLADGLVGRLTRDGSLTEQVEDGVRLLAHGGTVVASLREHAGTVVVDVDARAGAGDPVRLRRLGSPHPDRERSAAGWRRLTVRTSADASRVVQALRAPRERAAEPRRGRFVREVGPYAVEVGGIRVRRIVDPPAEAEDRKSVV